MTDDFIELQNESKPDQMDVAKQHFTEFLAHHPMTQALQETGASDEVFRSGVHVIVDRWLDETLPSCNEISSEIVEKQPIRERVVNFGRKIVGYVIPAVDPVVKESYKINERKHYTADVRTRKSGRVSERRRALIGSAEGTRFAFSDLKLPREE